MESAVAAEHASSMMTQNPLSEVARLTVRLSAITANYRHYRATGTDAAAVVKADAYGLGADAVATTLAGAGCDTFCVARLEEGVALRRVLSKARIFVFDGAPAANVPALVAHNLIPCLNSLAEIAAWNAAAQGARTTLEAAVHVDTGMSRLGLPPDELTVLAAEHRVRLAGINLVLVMSHLACADDAGDRLNAIQLSKFRYALSVLPPAPASLAASHGTFLGPDYRFDLLRPGVALYGANPTPGRENPMQTAAVLTGKVLQMRRIDRDDPVGYAATFHAQRPSMLATIALGYADGVPRALSNRGVVALGGRRATIAGRVSMDTIILDVTDFAVPPNVGDDAEIIGDTVSLTDMADMAGTNEYEILTRLKLRVPRHYEGASAQAGATPKKSQQ